MVHKLRSRDICHTSPRSNQIRADLYGETQGTVTHSTPNHHQRKREDINSPIKRIQNSMLKNVSQVEHLRPLMFNQRREEMLNVESSITGLNVTHYELKLRKLVDECIFSHTFKKRRGVSLYAIKKAIRENHSYNPITFSKPVSQYIASSIATGKLCQTTGHGASGTFRLNRTEHKKYVRQLQNLRKVSSQSHGIQRRPKQNKPYNTIN
ncbi:uncharacterized protein LOC118738072 [Rhagoletis pomonella]|uniref:uncharacterized protein LOC118738072 n=1 Tax=Rhagoletis pomonella TaxID=28610 RepID=UPI00177BB29B|nr:uncharacterized protein LOC118738072 [Rhagoletis pomonella]